MFVLGGQLFLQYQNNEMKNIDIIMRESQNKFIHNPVCMKNDDNYFMIVYVSNVQDLFEEILLKIPEFISLFNQSHEEKCDDMSMNDSETFISDTVKSFFIMYGKFQDCYRCVNQPKDAEDPLSCGYSSECNTCIVNPAYRNNFRRRDDDEEYVELIKEH